jgi:hypothetical protein
MSLTFHWFLPTSGDGRAIVGRGHSVPLVGLSAGPGGLATGPRLPGRPSSSASPACSRRLAPGARTPG